MQTIPTKPIPTSSHLLSSFDDLVDNYYPELHSFALSLTRNEQSASSLVEETFFFYLHHLAETPSDTVLDKYLYNMLFSLHEFRNFEETDTSVLADHYLANIEEPEEEYYLRGNHNNPLDIECFGQIDHSHRTLLLLSMSKQYTESDIANMLRVEESMVHTMIKTSMYLLKKCFVMSVSRVPLNMNDEDLLSA